MVRVPYVERDDLDPEYRDLIDSTLQPEKTLNLNRALGNNLEVLRGFREFFGALWNHSGLSDRQRELAILNVAAEVGSEYEWQQHVRVGSGVGLSPEEIAAIARDDRSPFDDAERALAAYARAAARGRVSDALHAHLREHFDDEALVGVATIASSYVGVARLLDALEIDFESGEAFVGWEPQ